MTRQSWRPRHLLHLARRAWDSSRARPLGPREESEVAGLLDDKLAELFWAQPVMDQRHALEAARYALAAAPGRRDLARASLLHDCGKRHSRIGVTGRTMATVTALLRIPSPRRWAAYLDHARIGAEELAAAGAESVVVEFARHQDGERPADIVLEDWLLLKAADGENHQGYSDSQYDGSQQ